jgi:hypothetical protein
LYALLPTLHRLKPPAIDRRWDAPRDGPAKVAISESGVQLAIDLFTAVAVAGVPGDRRVRVPHARRAC